MTLDPRVARQLHVSRSRWVEREADERWHEWFRRTAALAYRGRAPARVPLRIHSLPGVLSEVLVDGQGRHCVIVDDELTATLAELRHLSMPGASPDAGYDKCILLLADAFRATDDRDRYAVAMGWSLPRRPETRRLRAEAFGRGGHSAETMVVLLHEIAHRVLDGDRDGARTWRDICLTGVDKLVEALAAGGRFREQALTHGTGLGLEARDAEQQLEAYLEHLRANEALLTEVACDLLAVLAFLNLESSTDVLDAPEVGPAGMTTRQVGDALLAAHGTLQNLQLLGAIQAVAGSATSAHGDPSAALDRPMAELTARSNVLVFLLSNLLKAWCEAGHLRAEWPGEVPAAKTALLRAIARRDATRTATLLDPLHDLDGVFHEAERYGPFARTAHERLSAMSMAGPGGRKALDAARWELAGGVAAA